MALPHEGDDVLLACGQGERVVEPRRETTGGELAGAAFEQGASAEAGEDVARLGQLADRLPAVAQGAFQATGADEEPRPLEGEVVELGGGEV